jgi:hypothetical protein
MADIPGEIDRGYAFRIYAVNADGSDLELVVEAFTQINFHRPNLQAAPRGGMVSFIAEPEDLKPELRVLSLDTRTVSTITPLISETIDPRSLDPETFELAFMQTFAAVVQGPGVWSPDGHSLAFVGAIAADNSDLFLHSFASESTTRLTDGPSETVYLNWSPDGRYVIHGAARTLYFGASGNQYDLQAIYAAQADGSGVHEVYPLDVSAHERFPGWVSDTIFLVDRWNWYEGYSNLRAVNRIHCQTQQLWPGIYEDRAFDHQSGSVLLSVPGPDSQGNACSNDEPGFVLVPVDGGEPQHLSVFAACGQSDIVWSPAARVFFAESSGGPVTIDLNGEIRALSIPSLKGLAISPDGDQWVVTDDGLWLEGTERESRLIFDRPASTPIWSLDGTRIFFFGPTSAQGFEGLQSLYMATGPDFIPQLLAAGFYEPPNPGFTSMVWVE